MTTATIETKAREFTQPALAVTIEEAAHMVGLSRAQFYRIYLDTGRISPMKPSTQSRVIDVEELREAYHKLRDDLRIQASHQDTEQ